MASFTALMFVYPAIAAPFPTGSKFSRSVQKWTGLNFVCQVLTSQVVRRGLQRKLGGQMKVRIKLFSLTDLLAGKVKSIDVRLTGSNYRGVPLGKLHISCAQPVWFSYKKKGTTRPGLRAPTLIKIEGDVSEKELGEALKTSRVSSALRMIKLNLPGLGAQQLQLLQPKVDLKDNLVKVETVLVTQGATLETGVPLTVVGSPKLEGDSKIVLQNLQVSSPELPAQEEFSLFCQELLNPLVDFCKMDRLDHAFRLQSLTIANDQLHYAGSLLIAPRAAMTGLSGGVARKQ
ncbi:MAG: LmeA family phospholipid-binding protein [Candidatus Melainabacteria bacterium]|nr:LmeA family phospholipid-binding protein [Candidatus Melainabacteria bacterium]